jgi:putative phosphoribosyl transferase
MVFASREDAGSRLGQFLVKRQVRADVVVGLPRGGVVVAAKVAQALALPLEVLVVRKIGLPSHREFAIGAIAEGGVLLLDQEIVERGIALRDEVDRVTHEEEQRLRLYVMKFHPNGPLDVRGMVVVLVDDGLATGATAEAAVMSLRRKQTRSVIVAVPVASTTGVHRLARAADEVIAFWEDPDFDAVGRYYTVFSETTDEEVARLLRVA